MIRPFGINEAWFIFTAIQWTLALSAVARRLPRLPSVCRASRTFGCPPSGHRRHSVTGSRSLGTGNAL